MIEDFFDYLNNSYDPEELLSLLLEYYDWDTRDIINLLEDEVSELVDVINWKGN